MTGLILKQRRTAAENKVWNVYFDHVADRRGNEVENYLVLEGKHRTREHVSGVAVLPVIDGKLLLVRSYRHPLEAYLWELPRGFVDAKETPVEAALRELTEETSLRCAPGDLVPLGFYAPDPGTIAARCALFAATRCTGVPTLQKDEFGLDAMRILDPDTMAAFIAQGVIEDAGTVIAYYRYRDHIAGR